MLKQRILSTVLSAEYVTTIHKKRKLNDDYNNLTQLLYSVIMVGLGPMGACRLEAHVRGTP